MATLGSTGKAEAQQFDRKRKLFLVPLVTIPPQLEEQISELADTHWGQIRAVSYTHLTLPTILLV